jgi:hypothetical protein
MRDFESSASRAALLSFPAKVLYTSFAALNLLGLVSSVVLYDGIVVFEARATPTDLYRRLALHYRPGRAAEGSAPDRAVPVAQRLVEVTHAHLFSMSVLLLVAGHLLLLSGASPRLKNLLIGTGVASVALHLAAPWLLFFGGTAYGIGLVYPLSGGLMLVSLGLMTAIPVWAMWKPRRA